MHPDYNHFVYSINFQKMQIPATQTSIFPGNNNPFSIKPTVLWVKISEKKNISFSSLRSRYSRLANRKKLILPLEKYFKTLKETISGTELCIVFQSGQNNGVKLWAFDEYSRAFPYKVILILTLQIK